MHQLGVCMWVYFALLAFGFFLLCSFAPTRFFCWNMRSSGKRPIKALRTSSSDWVLWLCEDERHLIWWRAARRPWKEITYELGVDRSTAWRQHRLALTKIASRLNAAAA